MARRWCGLVMLMLGLICGAARGEDGYRLWLRYEKVADAERLAEYRGEAASIYVAGDSPTMKATREELQRGLKGLLGEEVRVVTGKDIKEGTVVVEMMLSKHIMPAGGYEISWRMINQAHVLTISAWDDVGTLYGAFHLLRLMQTGKTLDGISISESPRIQRRILSHWDNPGGLIERGYAGASMWKWDELPGKSDERYVDYARACASIGINGVTLDNVNTKAEYLAQPALAKWAALADVFRPYGIRVYLTARYSAPVEIGGLKTADPLDAGVTDFWKKKADEIYKVIPDFGGFQVKANSEGQPGPVTYGRTHADGANMLAEALAPHGGIVMWRAFVYGKANGDRAPDAYNAFKPLDGNFADNVFVAIKNGPIDFQPREPFHPLFGAMAHTQVMPELEITQEYMGHQWHLVYLGEEWEEFFRSDTFAKGKGSTVARIAEGEVFGQRMTAIAGVANTGMDRNWCGSDFAQANWYAYGRLAWNPEMSAEQIADEWTRQTWGNDAEVDKTVMDMMRGSWETFIKYDTPLGITFLPQLTSHYAPDPANRGKGYGLDDNGIGFDRSETGNNMAGQYFPEARTAYMGDPDLEKTDLKWLLWFHHVKWDQRLKTGRTLWEEMCAQYTQGVSGAKQLEVKWQSVKGRVDDERWRSVEERLAKQAGDAAIWRDYSLRYFHTVNGMKLPADISEEGPMGPAPAKRDQEP